ncbi:MAG: flavodoxin family protein [Thermodesulfobacteriota bacterium]
MRIVVIHGAPRMEKGNTHLVLTPFLEGCSRAGAQVETVLLAKQKIKQCVGCFTCYAKTPGVCVHKDDMPSLSEKIRESDLMVFATPVYLDGMTSLAKTFLDRLVVFLDPHFEVKGDGLVHPLRTKFPEKLFLVSVCGYPGLHNFDPLVLHIKRVAHNLHSSFSGALLRPGVFSLLLSKKYPEKIDGIMAAISKAGEELVQTGKVRAELIERAAAEVCPAVELMGIANKSWDRELAKRDAAPEKTQ